MYSCLVYAAKQAKVFSSRLSLSTRFSPILPQSCTASSSLPNMLSKTYSSSIHRAGQRQLTDCQFCSSVGERGFGSFPMLPLLPYSTRMVFGDGEIRRLLRYVLCVIAAAHVQKNAFCQFSLSLFLCTRFYASLINNVFLHAPLSLSLWPTDGCSWFPHRIQPWLPCSFAMWPLCFSSYRQPGVNPPSHRPIVQFHVPGFRM